MGMALVFLLIGAGLVYVARRGFPLAQRASADLDDEVEQTNPAERFVEMMNPIRDRIVAEQGNHRTVWIRSRIEIGNACQRLRPHMDETSGRRLDAAYQRFNCIPEEAFSALPRRMGSGGTVSRLDQSAVKEVMLESITDILNVATRQATVARH